MVELSSPVAGVVDSISVDRSDKVKKGQVVATLKADIEQVSVNISEERLKLIKAEHLRAVELYREKAITLSDKDKSDSEKNLSELELQHAKANLEMRLIKSPIDGVVVNRYFNSGEFVENKPILKLAQLNPLKIEVVSPISNYGKIVKGMKASVAPEFGDYQNLIAEVVIVDKVIDAASGTFGVRLELDNKDYAIPGGLKCKVQFLLDTIPEKPHVAEIESTETTVMPDSEEESNESDEWPANVDNHEQLMCVSVGPYTDQVAINNLITELGSEVIKNELRTETETKTNYGVNTNTFNSAQEAQTQMQVMKAAGVVDIALLNNSGKYQISLGFYRHKISAVNRLNAMLKKGYQVSMEVTEKVNKTYWADIAYSHHSDDVLRKAINESHRRACSESVREGLLK